MMLHLYSHTGTHMDAPKHFVAGGGAIDQVNLQACVGTARVIDVTAVEANGVICIADLGAAAARIGAGSRVLLRTDWHRHVDADDFRSHMLRVSLQLAQWLLQQSGGPAWDGTTFSSLCPAGEPAGTDRRTQGASAGRCCHRRGTVQFRSAKAGAGSIRRTAAAPSGL